ncbi:hypothetical protein [Paenibacillus polymyxa]|nr:hypothetical protein [Paenibacillus polymyxa]MBY7740317.1 hypothetical protein [Paenibacillus polymyxa]
MTIYKLSIKKLRESELTMNDDKKEIHELFNTLKEYMENLDKRFTKLED